MPPEPLPWDRKDFVLKDRKHDRIPAGDALPSPSFGGGSNNHRWRDSCRFTRASPRRPPPSYHRQNGSYYQMFDESNGHGGTPSSSDDTFRSSNGRYNGGRCISRDGRGSFRRSPYHDGYLPSHVTSKRSVAIPINSPPSPHPLKDVVDKNSGGADGLRSDQDRDRDHSLGSIGWKPSKWSRQGSISLSRTVGSEVEETRNGLLDVSVTNLGEEAPARSPARTPVAIDDGLPKKKPRLTWGQGLAKYEKQKVEGSSNSGKEQVSESNPKVMEMAGSMSPVTPCSGVCSSPGTADMPFSKATNIDNDSFHHRESSAMGLENGSEDLPSKLDQLPTLSTLLTDLLQPEDACSGDSTSTRTTDTNKLLLFKAGISKELEKTECEIDLLEIELKSLNTDEGGNHSQYSLTSQSDSFSVPLLESDGASANVALNLPQVLSSVTSSAGESVMPACPSGEHESEMRLNTDIPQTAFNNGKSSSSGNEEPMSLDFVENVVAGNGSEISNHLYGGNSGASTGSDMSSHEKHDDNFISLIMSSNKDAAKRASHILDGASPTAQPQFDIWGSDRLLTCRKNDIHIREKLALLKHQIKFKERALTLKFRAFHHLWKEDLRLLSVRKQRPKSQKRLDLCSYSSQGSSQKHRSSIHSRFTLPGNLTLVPTADIVDFTRRLLSDSQFKLYRKNLKMPAFILDEKERRYSMFITKNNLIEDPPSFEKERSTINTWTQEEKGVFMEMLATCGKDFAKISSSLSHKTTADCIEFYYKNHKSESFRDVKKQLDQRKQWRCLSTSNYMVTSEKRWNREANAASLDMLGSPSVAVAHTNNTSRYQQKYAVRSVVSSFNHLKAARGSCSSLERVSSIELSGYEKEPACADALAGVYGALSLEAVSSCVTSSVSPPEKMNCLRMDRSLTPEVTQTIEEEDTCSDEGCGELISGDWIDEEKSLFIRALSMYGKDFSRISECVGTKSRDQCKIFFSKARKCLGLDQIHPVADIGCTPMSDANGGRSDTDDACVAEMDSAICSTQSCSRMDVDFMQSVANAGDEVFAHVGDMQLSTETDRSIEQYEGEACNREGVDGRVDGHESVLKVENLEIEPKNVQLKCVEGTDAAACKNSYGVLPHEDAVSTGDRESEKVYNGISASPVESSAASCVKREQLKPQITAEVQLGDSVEANSAAARVKSEVEVQEVEFQRVPLVSNAGSGESWRKIDTHVSNSVNFSLATESTGKETDFCTAQKMDASSSRSLNFSTHQHVMPVDLPSCSQKKSQLSSKKQDGVYHVPLSTVFPGPPSISSQGSFQVPFQSTLKFNEYMRKLHEGLATKDLYAQCLSRINLNQIDQSSHVISGYPLLVRNQNMVREKPVLRESHSEGNLGSQLNQFFVRDIPNENGEDSVTSSLRPEMFFFQRNEDTSESQLRSCSMSASREAEQQPTQRTGDVKLFGQILSNMSPQQQKSSFLPQKTDGHRICPAQKKPAYTQMSSSTKDGNSLVFPSRLESSGQSNLEELPPRSYGYWDGRQIQTGLSSLPDSATMLAAYQGPVARTSFFPAQDSSVPANGLATNFQHSYIRPRSANGTRLDSFQDLQKRSGYELAGLQRGGRTAMARLGVNMAGSGRGIFAGGAGVSDPVAALRMSRLYIPETWRGHGHEI